MILVDSVNEQLDHVIDKSGLFTGEGGEDAYGRPFEKF